jgi:uncharacterized membrane protein YebE (DUF533 family)
MEDTMNFSDLVGGLIQSGLSPSSGDRVRNAIEPNSGGNILESIAGMLGGNASSGQGGSLGNVLGGLLGGGAGKVGDLGSMLGGMLNKTSEAVGGQGNLAAGGLGALAGSILGGGTKSMGGAIGGGLMAILGAMALKAMKTSGDTQSQQAQAAPLGLREPQTPDEQQSLEHNAQLILRAMINAAKADGQIDETEIKRIVGKLQEMGATDEQQRYVAGIMQQPSETAEITAAVQGNLEMSAQLYAASLLAIEVDTPAEKEYLEDLAARMGLNQQMVASIRQTVGLAAS